MKIYNPKKGILELYEKKATSVFWDKHWETKDLDKLRNEIRSCRKHFLLSLIKTHIPKRGKILEGGCGNGHLVYCLNNKGYRTTGIDFAQGTIKRVKKALPELNVIYGDVRKLQFSDSCFDGYISLGVIEHFKEGYGSIMNEMNRVIKQGGFLFLAFPYMSPLRRFKAILGFYPEKITHKKGFYQYMLDHKSVINKFQKNGFKFIKHKKIDGIKGTKDEISIIKMPLQKIYDYKGKNILIRSIRRLLDLSLKPLFAHCILLIFEKQKI